MSETPAPFRSSEMKVLPEWIDFNGHLNMAYYNVLFDQGVDQAYEQLGFGPDYQRGGCTTYVAEFHVCYLRELLWHSDGWLAATGEGLTLHVDQSGPRVAPMPEAVLAKLDKMHRAHATLPKPTQAGRSIGIRRKST